MDSKPGVARRRTPFARALTLLVSAGAIATAALGASGPLVGHAATPVTYYFHGQSTDQANKVSSSPGTATFSSGAPTSTTPTGVVQAAEWPNDGHSFAESFFDDYWTGPVNSSVTGPITFDWWWSTANPGAIPSGANAYVTVYADPTFATGKNIIGQQQTTLTVGATPTENHTTINLPGCPCTVGTLLIEVSTTDLDTSGVVLDANYDSTAVPSSFSISTGLSATPTPTPTPTATPTANPGGGGSGNQLFHSFQSPYPYPHEPPPPSAVALLFGEPSIGVDWNTNNTMYQGDLNTWQVQLQYSQGVLPVATWNDRSDVATDASSLDARLISDHIGMDRVFVDQLAGAQSVQAYTNDDGGTAAPPSNSTDWTAESAGGFPSGVDHQSIGAGRYSTYTAPPTGAGTVYPHAVYYCSQTLVNGAFCARSDTGGATWGAGVSPYTTQCDSLHGKPRVGPDGVLYLPNKNCGGPKGLIVSKDNGATWTIATIPGTNIGTDPNQLDPDVAVGGFSGMGTVYYTYRDGNHHVYVVTSTDDAATWSTPVDLGTSFGIQSAQMTEVTAGDQNRAAVTFIGSTASGDDSLETFPGTWDLYVAFTYDGGQHWQTVDATPDNGTSWGGPVQRGGVCAGGTGCPTNGDGSTSRNMLDFNDVTIDNQGRVEVAYTDGCTGACKTDPNAAACSVGNQNCMGRNSSVFTLSDQTCGLGLLARYDPGFNNDPSCVVATATPESPVSTALLVGGGTMFAIVVGVLGTRRRRRNPPSVV